MRDPADLPLVADLPERPDLPDPLETFDGERVETPADWRAVRRPELKVLFQHYVYGYQPEAPGLDEINGEPAPDPPEVTADVAVEREDALDGAATYRELELSFPNHPDAPTIPLSVFLPADRDGSVPTFLGLNGFGNHAVVDEPAVPVREPWHDRGPLDRGEMAKGWAVPQTLSRGYGLATFDVNAIDPDRPGPTDGVHPHFDHPAGEDARWGTWAGTRWGTLAAWAWGASRCLDALEAEPGVDAERVGVVGMSRFGKTSLLAGALDERFALVVPHQSGTGGCACSRNNDQETVELITRTFPHWFADSFAAFGASEARLPVDQHLLLALVAPRPVLANEGLQDEWTNPPSALRALRAAEGVYEFLGGEGLGGADGDGVLQAPAGITDETAGDLLQYRRDTGHELNAGYWRAICNFADVQFERSV